MHGRAATAWDARELLVSFVRRDLTVRYRHAALGIAWAMLTPLFQVLLFSLVLGRFVSAESGVPYPVFACTGLIAWGLTASALRSALQSLSGNAFLVSKVAFPREVLPFASVLVALVDFAVTLVLLAGLLWWYELPLAPTAALLPLVVVVQLAFTTGLALLLAAANLWWHDVRHVFDVAITLWLFATPVLYPLPALDGVAHRLLALNPMTPIVTAYRDLLLGGTLPAPGPALATALAAVGTLALGLTVFRRAAPRFAEIA
jgi:ABC-type polysaccharide/polyol phosphate export permease